MADGHAASEGRRVQRPDRLQGRKHAQLPVLATAVRLGVEMQSDQYRIRVVVGAGTPIKKFSNAAEPNIQSNRFKILDEAIPDGSVGVGQREPVVSVILLGTDSDYSSNSSRNRSLSIVSMVSVFGYSEAPSLSNSAAVAVWTASVSSNSSVVMYSFCDPMLYGVGP
jgi:hypothetical protein